MQLNLLSAESAPLLQSLEWERITNALTNFCHFDSNKEKLKQTLKALSETEILDHYHSLNFFVELSQNDDYFHVKSQISSTLETLQLRQIVSRLTKNGVLTLTDIHQILCLMEAYAESLPVLGSWSRQREFYQGKEVLLHFHKKIIKPMRYIIDKDGSINYKNHPELSLAYEKLSHLEAKIRQTINSIGQDPDIGPRLQFSGHDIINDRFVIAVRTDSYQGHIGQIISRSESGQTLYVEPFLIRDLGNQRLELLVRIDEIINDLCLNYSNLLFSEADLILKAENALILIDEYIAKADFCLKYNLTEPEITFDGTIELNQFFHPLIANPIKNSFTLDKNARGLIISGPNTGGKTATLKAVALAHLFMHLGLFIPAKSSRLPIFDGIFYLGNDGQDLSQGLSSFSSEVKNYLNLFKQLKRNNLIIIDEIFNSTSSEEASALAIGMFEELSNYARCKIFISTHHQMLKTLMHSNEQFISAHVGFDLDLHRPNYRLNLGIPGSSMALSIFKNLSDHENFKTNILLKAQTILDSKLVLYENLLQDVNKKQIELDKLIDENLNLNNHLSNQKQAMEGVLRLKMQDTLAEYEKKLQKYLSEAENILRATQKGEITKYKQLETRSHSLEREITREENNFKKPINKIERQKPREYVVGQSYYAEMLGLNLELKSFNFKKNEAFVLSGNKTVRLPLDQLYLPDKRANIPRPKISFSFSSNAETQSHHYDCRGMRLEEFEVTIEKAVAELLMGAVPFLHVVHGHGDGVLKTWLRKYLKKFPELQYEIPEHSHDGATRINLVN